MALRPLVELRHLRLINYPLPGSRYRLPDRYPAGHKPQWLERLIFR